MLDDFQSYSRDGRKTYAPSDEPFFVYKNIRKNRYSIRKERSWHSAKNKFTKKVAFHAHCVILEDCTLKVSEAGRQRVIKEGRKNVHAGVLGKLVHFADLDPFYAANPFSPGGWEFPPESILYYNPYKTKGFVDTIGNIVHRARFIFLTPDGVFRHDQCDH